MRIKRASASNGAAGFISSKGGLHSVIVDRALSVIVDRHSFVRLVARSSGTQVHVPLPELWR